MTNGVGFLRNADCVRRFNNAGFHHLSSPKKTFNNHSSISIQTFNNVQSMNYDKKAVDNFFLEVLLPKLSEEASKGRWKNISPNNFGINHFDYEISLGLKYHVNEVWDIYIGACAVYDEDQSYDLTFEYIPVNYEYLESSIRKKLIILNQQFISTLPDDLQYTEYMDDNGNVVYIESYEDYIQVFISNFDNPQKVFSDICICLDKILQCFTEFDFQIPISEIKLNEEMAASKKAIENILDETLKVITPEEFINQKLKAGCFVTFSDS